MDLKALLNALKPFIKQIFDGLIVPEIQKLEGQIGSIAVRAVIDSVAKALEAQVDQVLT